MTTHIETAAPQAAARSGGDLMSRLPGLLRILGTGVLVIAMYSFLVKGWQQGNDIFRYLIMLGHTGVLAFLGLASGHWLREGKGARLLLILALASVPANFAILGAFVFSQSGAAGIHHYPDYLAWSVDSMTTALLTTAGALLVLIPVIWLGFSVLARSMSRQLMGLFLFSNAALLLPLRSPLLIGLMVLAFAAINIAFSSKMSQQQITARTREGITALALQFLPLTVLMGRSLWLYSYDLFLFNVLAITVFFIMRQTSLYLLPGSKLRGTVDAFSLLPAVLVTPLLAMALNETGMIAGALQLPAGALVSAIMFYDISRRSAAHSRGYRAIAAQWLMWTLAANLLIQSNVLAALICVATGFSLVIAGYQRHQRSFFASGIALILFGMLHQLFDLLHQFDLGSWAVLAVVGVLAIVLGSTIESQRGRIRVNYERLKSNYRQWD